MESPHNPGKTTVRKSSQVNPKQLNLNCNSAKNIVQDSRKVIVKKTNNAKRMEPKVIAVTRKHRVPKFSPIRMRNHSKTSGTKNYATSQSPGSFFPRVQDLPSTLRDLTMYNWGTQVQMDFSPGMADQVPPSSVNNVTNSCFPENNGIEVMVHAPDGEFLDSDEQESDDDDAQPSATLPLQQRSRPSPVVAPESSQTLKTVQGQQQHDYLLELVDTRIES